MAADNQQRNKRRRRTSGRGSGPALWWRWLTGLALVVLGLGLGLLTWSRTDPGQAFLLQLGSQKMYGQVQAVIDQALSETLPGWQAGDPLRDCDWPAPHLGVAAQVRCRLIQVMGERDFAGIQLEIVAALDRVGGRVLWGERLVPEVVPSAQLRPNEDLDLLRLDIGVSGNPTHTLVLFRGDQPPDLAWGRGPGRTAWGRLLAEGGAPTVALVIDDWGVGRTQATGAILDLPVPLTLSVLPGLPYSRHFALQGTELILPQTAGAGSRVDDSSVNEGRAARRAAGCFVEVSLGRADAELPVARREILLHLPMQPQGYPDTDPGPGAVMIGMTTSEVATLVDRALATLPSVRGVNNHMGSAATSDRKTMADLMQILQKRGLFFLDSLTASGSVAYAEALRAGMPALRNRIFLDYEHENPHRIRANLQRLVQCAKATGFAVGICHPHPATAEVLAREIPLLRAAGVRFVTASELLALQSVQPAAGAGV